MIENKSRIWPSIVLETVILLLTAIFYYIPPLIVQSNKGGGPTGELFLGLIISIICLGIISVLFISQIVIAVLNINKNKAIVLLNLSFITVNIILAVIVYLNP